MPVLDHPCRTCRGESTVMMTRDIRINVPAGVRNLMELRVPGAGHAGSRGGKAGHLFVQVKVLPHERPGDLCPNATQQAAASQNPGRRSPTAIDPANCNKAEHRG
ncbi:dnaJ [Symbiodinium necroappetens]|uniref:DnaJ protein n=1 Tax=Symbiodinium necroappetens TaxID=1628268 RepID=A0A812P9Y6_9DINO|nr:dnaJ [Symbiodinium necroappetens]